jgi:hypothetical protein
MIVQAVNDNMAKLVGAQQESHQALIEAVTRPKKVIRGSDGRVAGVQ